MGNIIPALFMLPLITLGVFWARQHEQLLGPGLWLILAGVLLGIIALNWFGLYQNSKMETELRRLKKEHEGFFVGCARPSYHSWLDPHEEVGILKLNDNDIELIAETIHLKIERSEIQDICFRPNIHSLLFLGRWISIEGESEGRKIRLVIEPREKRTLFGNRRYSTLLKRIIELWHKKEQPRR